MFLSIPFDPYSTCITMQYFQDLFPVSSMDDVKVLIQTFCTDNGFNVRVAVTNSLFRQVVCKHSNCAFRIIVNKRTDGMFYLTEGTCFEHSCDKLIVQTPLVHSSYVANYLSESISDNAEISVSHVRHSIRRQKGLDLPYHTVHRGRKKAQVKFYGNIEDSFSKFKPFFEKLLEKENATVHLHAIVDRENHVRRFSQCFLCHESCKRALTYCRPVIVLDACHINNVYKGTVFAASCIDANESIVPIAIAIAGVENYENWCFFIAHLKRANPILCDKEFVIISDRAKGLLEAVTRLLPLSHHSFCVFHLVENVKSRFKVHKAAQNSIWAAAKSYNAASYNMHMQSLSTSQPQVYEFLNDIDHQAWSFHSAPLPKFGMATSNLAESFNSWIGKERVEPHFVLMFKFSRKLMELFYQRKMFYSSLPEGTRYPVSFQAKLQSIVEAGKHLSIANSSTTIKVVVDGVNEYEVDLESRTCDCGQFQQLQYPCKHAARALQNNPDSELIHSLIHPSYTLEWLKAVYEYPVSPVIMNETPSLVIHPPFVQVQPGRPKRVRNRTRGERGPGIRCSACKEIGHHNARSCPRRQEALRRDAASAARALRKTRRDRVPSPQRAKRTTVTKYASKTIKQANRDEKQSPHQAIKESRKGGFKPKMEKRKVVTGKICSQKATNNVSKTNKRANRDKNQSIQQANKKSRKEPKEVTETCYQDYDYHSNTIVQSGKIKEQIEILEESEDSDYHSIPIPERNKAKEQKEKSEESEDYEYHSITVAKSGAFGLEVIKVKTPKVISTLPNLLQYTEREDEYCVQVKKDCKIKVNSLAGKLGILPEDYILLECKEKQLFTNCYKEILLNMKSNERPIKLLLLRKNKL
jgi:MULE transposase domain/SWIM zinc finger